MHNNNEPFSYNYSSKEQSEVRRIRDKYKTSDKDAEDKLERLRALDRGVTAKANTASLIVGLISTLVLGIGMCCCMVWGGVWFALGIVIGVVGIFGVAMAYPVYSYIVKKERERIAPEIIRLSDELLK